MNYVPIIWFALVVVFTVGEVCTLGLVSIWFTGGSVVALLLSLLGADLWLQITAFLVISVMLLLLTRPLVKKHVNSKRMATNADRVIGMTAVVTEIISEHDSTGEVRLDGKYWTARTENRRIVDIGTEVQVVRIEGVKVIVREVAHAAQ